jgi:hypothetical protein
MRLTYRLDDGFGFLPRCAEVLTRISEPLYYTEQGLPHPVGLFNRRWTTVQETLLEALDAYETLQQADRTQNTISPEFKRLLAAHKRVLYDGAELIEDYEKNIRLCLFPPDKVRSVSFALSKGLRNHISTQCNKMKHEHAYMSAVEAKFFLTHVTGYSLCSYADGDTLRPDPHIHAQRSAFSFAIEFRKILANLYVMGAEVATYIENSIPLTPRQQGLTSRTQTVDLLERLTQLPIVVFPSERPAHMPIIEFDGQTLVIEEKNGPITHAHGSATVTALYEGDDVTRTFQVPNI